jgi:hypothetical protein
MVSAKPAHTPPATCPLSRALVTFAFNHQLYSDLRFRASRREQERLSPSFRHSRRFAPENHRHTSAHIGTHHNATPTLLQENDLLEEDHTHNRTITILTLSQARNPCT